LNREAIALLRIAADSVYIDEKITQYIVSLVTATRPARTSGLTKPVESLYRYISFGASPRASIALYRCSKILATFFGRDFVGPEDVKAAAYPVLRHRIVLSYEAEADGMDADMVISRILSHVPIP
jgi:MoxR-like ATPase